MSGDLRVNTIMGTVLASALVVMGLRIGGAEVFASHAPEKPGIEIDASAFTTASTGGPAKVEEGPVDWGVVLAAPDAVAAGQKLSTQCAACHTFTQGGPNGTGPNLYEVVNRTSGTHAGFNYSAPMKAHAAPWTYDELNAFLTSPGKHIKGTIMTFVGFKKQDQRNAMIAYLRSLAGSPAPLPAPLPPKAEAPADGAAAPADGAAPAAPAPAAPAAPAAPH